MIAQFPHNVHTMSAQHLMKKTYIPCEMLCGRCADIHISPGIYVHSISFFGFQLWGECQKGKAIKPRSAKNCRDWRECFPIQMIWHPGVSQSISQWLWGKGWLTDWSWRDRIEGLSATVDDMIWLLVILYTSALSTNSIKYCLSSTNAWLKLSFSMYVWMSHIPCPISCYITY